MGSRKNRQAARIAHNSPIELDHFLTDVGKHTQRNEFVRLLRLLSVLERGLSLVYTLVVWQLSGYVAETKKKIVVGTMATPVLLVPLFVESVRS